MATHPVQQGRQTGWKNNSVCFTIDQVWVIIDGVGGGWRDRERP